MVIAALSDNPIDAVWLIIAFTVLQQLEGHVVAPNVFGQALRINPILVIFALLMGGQLAGFVGAFIALPIAAILRETIVYLRRHLRFQRWDLPAEPPPRQPTQTHCPECGVLGRRGRGGVPRLRDRARRPRRGGLGGRGRARMTVGRGRQALRGQGGAARRLVRRCTRASALAIIGPNGAGKTTLLQILAGSLAPDEGEVDLPPRGLGPAARGGLLQADRAREPAAVRAAREGAARRAWRACSS